MTLMQSTPRKITLLIAPVAILISMLFAFSLLTKLLGFKWGYFVAFVLYWLVWGLLFPHWILGVEGLKNIFRSVAAPLAQPALLYFVLLVLPPLLAGITAFRANVSKANLLVFLISAGLALVNGTLEEVLWRGTFITVFSDQLVLGYLYPALGFAVWHLAPQIVHRSSMPGGTVSFILGALFLGLCWGWVAWRTRSIRWTVISHVLTDFMGLGALVYLRG